MDVTDVEDIIVLPEHVPKEEVLDSEHGDGSDDADDVIHARDVFQGPPRQGSTVPWYRGCLYECRECQRQFFEIR